MKRSALAITGIVLMTGCIFAQSLVSFPLGEDWQLSDARTLGMAGAGSVSNATPGALLMNPAALNLNSNRLDVQISATLRNLEERRSFPIYNRIDDITQQGVYVINDNWYSKIQGAIQYNFQGSIPVLKSIAIGSFTEIDQDFGYLEEVRENIFGDEQVAYNEFVIDGGLTRYSLGLGLAVANGLDAGIQIGTLRGDLSREKSVEFIADPDDNILETSTRTLDNSPMVATLGAIYEISPRASVGSHLQLPYTIEYQANLSDSTGSTDFAESIEYPMALNVGFEYRGRQELLARLNVDFAYEWWSNSDIVQNDDALGLDYDDAISVRTAIEHIFFNQIPLRVGLQYRTAFQTREVNRTMITLGSGFAGENWQVDVASGFSNLSYAATDLFDDSLFGGDRSSSLQDDVEEKYFFGMVSLRAFLK